MDRSIGDKFQSVWRLAVVVCALLAIITTIVVSCTKAPDTAGPAPAQTTEAPENTPGPEATAEPTPVPTEEPTPETEPNADEPPPDVSE